jgi:hypothetical protein
VTPLLEASLVSSSLIPALLVIKSGSTRQMHSRMAIYRLSFPTELEAEAVERFMAALSGLLPPWYTRWLVRPAVFFEVVATQSGIVHQLVAPARIASDIEAAMSAHLPSVRYEPLETNQVTDRDQSTVSVGAEYRLTTTQRTLRSDPVGLSAGLLASLWPLGPGEIVTVQWLVTPAAPVQPPRLRARNQGVQIGWDFQLLDDAEAVTALKAKQAEPLLLATARISATAGGRERARSLLRHAETPWHASRAPGVYLMRRLLPEGIISQRVQRRSVPLTVYPVTLNVVEASGLIGWPIGLTGMPGLTLGGCRLLPVAGAVATAGTVLGSSTFPATAGRPVALDDKSRRHHLWVCGPTGIGKTTLLARLALADIEAGHPTIVIDPKGELIVRICQRLPEHRLEDVIVLDATDDQRPVGYNPLKCTPANRELVVEQTLGVMRSIWKWSWGPRLDDIVRACLLTLTAVGGMTLAEVPSLITDEAFRGRILPKVHDPFGVDAFWATFNSWSKAEQVTNVQPVLNKVRALAGRSRLRGVLGQVDPAVDLPRIIRNRQVLLVNLAAGNLGTDAAYLLGSLLFSGVWDAISARASMPEERRSMVACYLDEFQHMVALPTPAETILAEGRSYGLALTLAHQNLGQLDRDLQQAVKANARTKLVFQTSRDDAQVFAKELGGGLTPEDLMGIAAHEAVVAAFAAGRTQPPATIALPDLEAPIRRADDVVAQSRQHFGVERSEVDAALQNRLSGGRARPTPMGRSRRNRP